MKGCGALLVALGLVAVSLILSEGKPGAPSLQEFGVTEAFHLSDPDESTSQPPTIAPTEAGIPSTSKSPGGNGTITLKSEHKPTNYNSTVGNEGKPKLGIFKWLWDKFNNLTGNKEGDKWEPKKKRKYVPHRPPRKQQKSMRHPHLNKGTPQDSKEEDSYKKFNYITYSPVYVSKYGSQADNTTSSPWYTFRPKPTFKWMKYRTLSTPGPKGKFSSPKPNLKFSLFPWKKNSDKKKEVPSTTAKPNSTTTPIPRTNRRTTTTVEPTTSQTAIPKVEIINTGVKTLFNDISLGFFSWPWKKDVDEDVSSTTAAPTTHKPTTPKKSIQIITTTYKPKNSITTTNPKSITSNTTDYKYNLGMNFWPWKKSEVTKEEVQVLHSFLDHVSWGRKKRTDKQMVEGSSTTEGVPFIKPSTTIPTERSTIRRNESSHITTTIKPTTSRTTNTDESINPNSSGSSITEGVPIIISSSTIPTQSIKIRRTEIPHITTTIKPTTSRTSNTDESINPDCPVHFLHHFFLHHFSWGRNRGSDKKNVEVHFLHHFFLHHFSWRRNRGSDKKNVEASTHHEPAFIRVPKTVTTSERSATTITQRRKESVTTTIEPTTTMTLEPTATTTLKPTTNNTHELKTSRTTTTLKPTTTSTQELTTLPTTSTQELTTSGTTSTQELTTLPTTSTQEFTTSQTTTSPKSTSSLTTIELVTSTAATFEPNTSSIPDHGQQTVFVMSLCLYGDCCPKDVICCQKYYCCHPNSHFPVQYQVSCFPGGPR